MCFFFSWRIKIMNAVRQNIGIMFLFWRRSDLLLFSFRSDAAACTGGLSSSPTRRRPCLWRCSPTWATASSPSSATSVTSSATGRSSGATAPGKGRSRRWAVGPGVRRRSWACIKSQIPFNHCRVIYRFWVFSDTSDICFRSTCPTCLHVIPVCDICNLEPCMQTPSSSS